MKTINLKMSGLSSKLNPIVKIDDSVIKGKKNEFGSYEASYETEKDEVEISISRNLELNSKLWWLYSLISFIVSIFGIFEPPYDRKNIVVDCKFVVKLNDINEIKIKFNSMAKQGKAVEIETQNEFNEIKNEYYVDKKAKTKWRILIILKLVIWVAIIIVGVYFLINR